MAAADYYTQVYTMFVGYFGRPPTQSGLDYYAGLVDKAGGNVAVVIDDFFKSAESKAFFDGKTVEQQVNQIFQNLFGRDAAPAGLNYWAGLINNGVVALAQAAYTIAFNAAPADVAVRDAKIASAKAWVAGLDTTAEVLTYGTDSGRAAGRDFLNTVKTSTPATQDAVDAALKSMVDGGSTNPGLTLNFTKGLDTLVGSVGNDVFVASVDGGNAELNTMSPIDTVNGAGGIDTLKVNAATALATTNLASLSGVEVIEVSAANSVNLDTSALAGVTNLNVIKAGSNVTLTGGAATDISVKLSSPALFPIQVNGGNNVNVALTGSGASGTQNAITVGNTTAAMGDVVVSSTNAAAVNGTNIAAATTNVTGGKTITVTQKAGAASGLVAGGAATTHSLNAVNAVANASTTSVTVNQDANVTAVAGTVAVAGVTEVASVKFSAMTAGQTLIAGGLTFTASKALTAAEAAATFANLAKEALPVANSDTQGSGVVANGTYTGAFTGWTSGAVSGDTVVFTSTAALSAAAVADLTFGGTGTATVTTSTQGVNAVTGVAAKLGVAAGTVTVTDGVALKTVTVDGYSAAGSKIQGTAGALETLTLKNGGSFTVADTADTLTLNLEKITAASDLTFTTAPKTLNVNTIGDNHAHLVIAATETLNVSGTGTLQTEASMVVGALKTVKVTGTAGLTLQANQAGTVTSVDTTGTTGTVTTTIEGARSTYTGGAGKDVVTLATDTALTKAINLGGGDDTLSFGALAVTGSTAAVNGGEGTDTLSMSVATAAALDAAPVTFYTGFERLTLNDAGAGGETLDLANLGITNYVTTSGSGGTLILDKLANNGTVVLTAAPTTGVTVQVAGAAAGTADVLNLVLSSSGNLAAGLLTAANVETVNISTVDTEVVVAPAVQTKNVDSLTLTADKATTVNVSGAADLTLTLTGSTKVTSIDGSAMTGGLTVTSLNNTSATTIKGGSGNDVLTAATGTTADVLLGGAGSDKLVANAGLTTMTGGTGNDLFVINVASANVNSYATVTDFAAGDLLQINGATTFASTKVTLADTAVFQDYANEAINQLGANAAGWFQFGGNTYVVADMGADTTVFTENQDFIVKLTGLVDLTNASFNVTNATIALT